MIPFPVIYSLLAFFGPVLIDLLEFLKIWDKLDLFGIKPKLSKCRFELIYFYDLLSHLSPRATQTAHRSKSRYTPNRPRSSPRIKMHRPWPGNNWGIPWLILELPRQTMDAKFYMWCYGHFWRKRRFSLEIFLPNWWGQLGKLFQDANSIFILRFWELYSSGNLRRIWMHCWNCFLCTLGVLLVILKAWTKLGFFLLWWLCWKWGWGIAREDKGVEIPLILQGIKFWI
jgi:hypothetical protein